MVERPDGIIFSYKLLQSSYYVWVYLIVFREREPEALNDVWKDWSGFSSAPTGLRVALQLHEFGCYFFLLLYLIYRVFF